MKRSRQREIPETIHSELSGNAQNINIAFPTITDGYSKPLLLFEMFAGYGGASFALKKAGIPFKCIGYSEIDKFAIQCYEQNHGKIKNFGDCRKIIPNNLPDFDLLTAGFPCQSFSAAGKGLGEQDTRGTLFHDIIRIAEIKKPKLMLLENVKGLTFKKHRKTFNKILSELTRIGYSVNWKILNSKEHGIPQNRERIFFACFRDNTEYTDFSFQEKQELKIFLKDILEDKVDEKYYLSTNRIKQLLVNIKEKGKWNVNPSGNGISGLVNNKNIANTLTSSDWKDPQKIIQLNNPSYSSDRVYSYKGLTPTLTARNVPYLLVKTNTKRGYDVAIPGDGIRLEQPASKTARARVLKQLSGTLMRNDGRGVVTEDFRIRKLTPKECFRLMGFLDDEINLEGLSNSQRYKLAGNGWCIQTASKIFTEMFRNSKSSATLEFNKAA